MCMRRTRYDTYPTLQSCGPDPDQPIPYPANMIYSSLVRIVKTRDISSSKYLPRAAVIEMRFNRDVDLAWSARCVFCSKRQSCTQGGVLFL